jgi:cytochrome oxidase Cu insertion factor (SCO1/SenC/PrrC family)
MARLWLAAGLGIPALAVGALAAYLAISRPSPEADASATTYGVPDSPAVHHPEVAGMRVVEEETLHPPRPAPGFALTNYTGQVVDLSDLSGKVVLLSFVYTNCSEACPLLAGHYLRIQQEMADYLGRGELVLVFITTDPDRDTPENLMTYTEGRGGKWLFLTGDLPLLKRVWDDYGVYREVRERLQDVTVYHSYKSYLIDGEGRLRHRYTGVWQFADVADDLGALLAERRPPVPTLPPAPDRAADFRITLYGDPSPDGATEVRLSSVLALGRPVVLNFWAGACPPCRREMPDLQQVYELNKDRIELLGVDSGPFLGLGTAAEAEQLVREMGITYPTGAASDPKVMQDYGVFGMPTTFFIKPDGEIVGRRMGLLTREKLDRMIEDLVDQSRMP